MSLLITLIIDLHFKPTRNIFQDPNQNQAAGSTDSPPTTRRARTFATALGGAWTLLATSLAISAPGIPDNHEFPALPLAEHRAIHVRLDVLEVERSDTTSCRRCHPFVASLRSIRIRREELADDLTSPPCESTQLEAAELLLGAK